MIVVGFLFLLATAHVLSEGNGGNYKAHCIEKEKKALLISFKGVVDPSDTLSSWTNSSDLNCCNWRHITCDTKTNHVIKIDFSDARLFSRDYAIGGEIGSSLVELRHLEYLDLGGNNFVRIPKFIGSFQELTHLSLAGNPIGGTIPPQLGNLTKLQSLDLSRDYYYDYDRTLIADNFAWLSHLTSLKTFTMMNANFTRAGLQSFKVPPSLSRLEVSNCLLPPKVDTSSLSSTNSSNLLETLILKDNSIHPTGITWFLNSSNNLVSLTLLGNFIDGSFPDSFGNKNSLSYVALESNEVESGVPKSLGNLTNVITLDLFNNNLSGTLPDLLENLTCSTKNSLETLSLEFNQLRGSILDDKNTFPSLRELYLDNNQLEGPFPNRLSRFPDLRILVLDNNQLTGPLPDLSSMSNLTIFSAVDNKFNVTSTESIGELIYLETLDISSNSLTGVISEAQILRCPRLKKLHLSYNSALTLRFNSSSFSSFQLKSVKLSSCKLGPEFPSWLQTQSDLEYLDISNSDIYGLIPNWFGNITSKLIYLNMSFNLLNGTLPYFPISANRVDLRFNQFQGSIPPSLSNVTQLFLSNNELTDCRSFLCEARKTFLVVLVLSNNQFSGSLPDCWGNFESLAVLDLGNNKFFGEIPTSISSNWRELQTLQLRNNNFSGTLPSSLKNCSLLQVLDVGKNALKGTIPSWIGERLTSLVFLSVKSNKFYGSIPLNLCQLTEIQILDISSNDLSGVIPSCIENFTSMVQMATTLEGVIDPIQRFGSLKIEYDNVASIMWKGIEYEYEKNLGFLRIIDLSSNNLAGEIPVQVTYLVQLVQLNLSRNYLSGAIPEKIGKMTRLESLDLSHNKLSGKIPISLAKVSTLNHLDLSSNRLSGRIPTGTQLQSFNASTYGINNGLCGPPLISSCPGDKTSHDPPTSTPDDESYDEFGETWFDKSWFYIGIGAGFATGFCGVCGNLLLNTSLRIAYFRMMQSLGDWLYVMITVKGAALRGKLAWH